MFLKICVGGNRPVAHPLLVGLMKTDLKTAIMNSRVKAGHIDAPLLVGLMKTDLKTAIMNSRVKAGHIDAAALGPDENRRFYVKLIL